MTAACWPPFELALHESLHRERATGDIVVIRRTHQWRPYPHTVIVRRASGVEHSIPRAHVDLYFDSPISVLTLQDVDQRPLPAQFEALSKMLGDSDE